MHLADERMIVILLVGVAAGYLAGRFARGSGSGPVCDAAVGIVGARVANFELLPRFGVHLLGGIARLVIESAIGATALLLIIGLVGASGRGVSGHSSAYRR